MEMRPSGFPVLALAGAMILMGLFRTNDALGQAFSGSVHAGWGTNLLISPGQDLTHRPGRTGYVALGLTVGKPDRKVLFQPAVRIEGSAFRTEMAYQVFFNAIRTTAEVDLLVGFRQMSGTTLQAGVFGGLVTSYSANMEQGRKNTLQPTFPDPRVLADHFPRREQFGLVLGLLVPLDSKDRFALEFQFRQFLTPIMDLPQSLALPFKPDQLVIAENSKPSILTLGLGFRFR